MAGEEKVAWQCGRLFTAAELLQIQEVTALFPRLSRKELASTICEQLGWRTASGEHKVDACRKLLEKMAACGEVALPTLRGPRTYRQRREVRTDLAAKAPAAPMIGKLGEYAPVRVVPVVGEEDLARCVADVERYHELGYRRPIGFSAHYAIESRQGRLGYLIMAGAAKQIGIRDRWIGWDDPHRLRNLPWAVNNTRFLLFPWVQVRYGASHALGQLARRLATDWEDRWGYRPVLLETFVDPARYDGTCYRAAGWVELGRTTGTGLCRPGRIYRTTPKLLFVRPLTADFRSCLCGDPAPRGEQE